MGAGTWFERSFGKMLDEDRGAAMPAKKEGFPPNPFYRSERGPGPRVARRMAPHSPALPKAKRGRFWVQKGDEPANEEGYIYA